MDKLPSNIIQHIYEYDPTYKFWNSCLPISTYTDVPNVSKNGIHVFGYCKICRTYLRFCHQIYFDKDSVYEYDLNDIVQLSFWFKEKIVYIFSPLGFV